MKNKVLNYLIKCEHLSVIIILILIKLPFCIESEKNNIEETANKVSKRISWYKDSIKNSSNFQGDSYAFGPGLNKNIWLLLLQDSSYINKIKIFQFYSYVIENSTNDDVIREAFSFMGTIANHFKKQQEMESIIENALKNKYIYTKIYAANNLFTRGHKEKALSVYLEILNINSKELEKTMNQRIIPSHLVFSQKITKRKEEQIKNNSEIIQWKFGLIQSVISHLIDYDDASLNKVVKKAIENNYYIANLLSIYKSMEVSDELTGIGKNRREFIDKLEKIIK